MIKTQIPWSAIINAVFLKFRFNSYKQLFCQLILPRIQLRQYLKTLGNYTVIHGSTLSLGGSDRFYRSQATSPYQEYIERNHGTNAVTASVHINIGFRNVD